MANESPAFGTDDDLRTLLILLIESFTNQLRIVAQTSAAQSALLKAVHDRMPDIGPAFERYLAAGDTARSPAVRAIDDEILRWQTIAVELNDLFRAVLRDEPPTE